MASVQDNIARFQEIANRGLQERLDPEKRARFDEAVRRGIITLPQKIPTESESIFGGAGEALQTIGSSMGGSIEGGIAGLGQLFTGQGVDEAVKAIQDAQEGRLILPQSQEGMDKLKSITGFFDSLGKAVSYLPSQAAYLGQRYIGSDEAGAEKTRQEIQERGLPKSFGEATFKATGSPLAATVAEFVPDIAGDIATGGIPAVAAKRGVSSKLFKLSDTLKTKAVKMGVAGDSTEDSIRSAVRSIQTATPEEIISMIDADPKFFQALDELQISAEPIASMASRNPQFSAIENGLRSIPASALSVQADNFIKEVAKKADDLVESYGGTKDKAFLSERFRTEMLDNVDNLYKASDELYKNLDNVLDKSAATTADDTVNFLDRIAVDMGGPDRLPGKLKGLYNDIANADRPPTIGFLDQKRKEIGQALGRIPAGQFKDGETGQLKALYATLSEDVNRAVDLAGHAEMSKAARGLTRQRKVLEDSLETLLGNNLKNDLSTVTGTAVKQLMRGNVNKFKASINNIPKKYRQEALASAMNDIFKGTGQGQEAFGVNNFLKSYNQLERQPALKSVLYQELPDGMGRAIDNLAVIAKGINQADRRMINTGKLMAFFEPNAGMVSKMMGGVGKLYLQSKAGPAGTWAANTVSNLIKQGNDPSRMTAQLLASDDFLKTIRQAVKEGVFDGAEKSRKLAEYEKAMMRSNRYKKWAESLPSDKKALATGSFISFLNEGEDE